MQTLQQAYRQRVRGDTHVFHALANSDALENSVLKLRDDLGRLRRGARRWAVAVAILLVLCAAGVAWLVKHGGDTSREVAGTKAELEEVRAELAKLREALGAYPLAEAQVRDE